jgi:hypothetical protein
MAKPTGTAQPLPRYVERTPLKTGGWGHFFHVPSKYKWKGMSAARRTARP